MVVFKFKTEVDKQLRMRITCHVEKGLTIALLIFSETMQYNSDSPLSFLGITHRLDGQVPGSSLFNISTAGSQPRRFLPVTSGHTFSNFLWLDDPLPDVLAGNQPKRFVPVTSGHTFTNFWWLDNLLADTDEDVSIQSQSDRLGENQPRRFEPVTSGRTFSNFWWLHDPLSDTDEDVPYQPPHIGHFGSLSTLSATSLFIGHSSVSDQNDTYDLDRRSPLQHSVQPERKIEIASHPARPCGSDTALFSSRKRPRQENGDEEDHVVKRSKSVADVDTKHGNISKRIKAGNTGKRRRGR